MLLQASTRRAGTSLLEVLASTALFLTSIVAIGKLMDISTDLAIDVRDRSRATRLAESKLNEFVAGVEALSGSTSGTFEEESGFSWKADVAAESTAANLYRVTLTITRDNPAESPIEVVLTQFVFDPRQKGQLTTTTATDSSASGSSTTGSTGTPAGGTGGTGGTGTGGTGTGGTGRNTGGTGGNTGRNTGGSTSGTRTGGRS